jgi:hypothetical protein
MARKFFRFSIQELETLFSEKADNIEVLMDLEEELDYRKTDRAARLRNHVVERLAGLRTSSRGQPSQNHKPLRSSRSQSFPRSHQDQLATDSQSSSQSPDLGKPQPAGGETIPIPPITNGPEDILSTWMALEVLSPQFYVRPEDLAGGDRRRVVALGESPLPWERGEKSRPNQRLYYQVVLGSMKVEPAVGRLIERYGDSREEKVIVRGRAALATVMVDRQGRLVQSPAVGISSFGWGPSTMARC